jgi:hypothetical protein
LSFKKDNDKSKQQIGGVLAKEWAEALKMRILLKGAAIALAMSLAAFAQTAGQDMKRAGSDTKNAAKSTGSAVKRTTKTTGSKIKSGTHTTAQKVSDKTQSSKTQSH